jgi:hypothetical protein
MVEMTEMYVSSVRSYGIAQHAEHRLEVTQSVKSLDLMLADIASHRAALVLTAFT